MIYLCHLTYLSLEKWYLLFKVFYYFFMRSVHFLQILLFRLQFFVVFFQNSKFFRIIVLLWQPLNKLCFVSFQFLNSIILFFQFFFFFFKCEVQFLNLRLFLFHLLFFLFFLCISSEKFRKGRQLFVFFTQIIFIIISDLLYFRLMFFSQFL